MGGGSNRRGRSILVLDVGGSHVKMLATGMAEPVWVRSGPSMTAKRLVRVVRSSMKGRRYDAISLGYPGPVLNGRPLRDPANLGRGWVGFDFAKAFGCPVKIVNDAALQALGSYAGGSMLFLGLGTGLGTAMIVDGVLEPLEMGHLPYRHGRTYEDYLGEIGLQRLGPKRWEREVRRVVREWRAALEPGYIVLGGGNVRLLERMPPGCRRGRNENACLGGFLLWGSALSGTLTPSRALASERGPRS